MLLRTIQFGLDFISMFGDIPIVEELLIYILKTRVVLTWNMMTKSNHNYAHPTKVGLLCDVQHVTIIWRNRYKSQRKFNKISPFNPWTRCKVVSRSICRVPPHVRQCNHRAWGKQLPQPSRNVSVMRKCCCWIKGTTRDKQPQIDKWSHELYMPVYKFDWNTYPSCTQHSFIGIYFLYLYELFHNRCAVRYIFLFYPQHISMS